MQKAGGTLTFLPPVSISHVAKTAYIRLSSLASSNCTADRHFQALSHRSSCRHRFKFTRPAALHHSTRKANPSACTGRHFLPYSSRKEGPPAEQFFTRILFGQNTKSFSFFPQRMLRVKNCSTVSRSVVSLLTCPLVISGIL